MSDERLDLALYGAFDGSNLGQLARGSGLPPDVVRSVLLRLHAEHRSLQFQFVSGAGLSPESFPRFKKLESVLDRSPARDACAELALQDEFETTRRSINAEMVGFVLRESVRAAVDAVAASKATSAMGAVTTVIEAYRHARQMLIAGGELPPVES